MTKTILLSGKELQYELDYKRVKNINLRIRTNGTVYVSANRRVPLKIIEDFLTSKESFILKALENIKKREAHSLRRYFSENELCETITNICKTIYPYYKSFNIPFPEIRFRKMISRWGSCHPVKKVLTFNTALMYAPHHCVEYVVWHEFTHFLHPNHSKAFYTELSKVFPDWKESRRILKEINIITGE